MLSRIAESMFWIGRYVERAEDTARILDVQTQLLLEDAAADESQTCRDLLSIMGVEPDDPAIQAAGVDIMGSVDIEQVLRLLAYNTSSPISIASALAAARESARRARETTSIESSESMSRRAIMRQKSEASDALIEYSCMTWSG